MSNQEIVPEQFASNCFRRDRSFHGGGVLIAVREGISCVPVDTPHVKDSEQVWVKIMSPNKPDLYIGSFYRPPSAGDSPLIELEATLTNLPWIKRLFLAVISTAVRLTGFALHLMGLVIVINYWIYVTTFP